MKKLTLILLLLLSLFCLAACGTAQETSTPYSITDELTQRYEITDLRWQEGLFRAVAHPIGSGTTAAAGLHASTGRLIVAYADELGREYWLECHTLTATEQAVAIEQEIPLNTWLTNAETPEHRAELLLQSGDGQLYAVYLRSERMTEEEMLSRANTVHVWLPGAEDAISVSCDEEKARILRGKIPWTQSGDEWPDAEDGTLTLRVDSSETDLVSDGSWRLQRLDGGRWYDMDQRGEGLHCDGSSVWGSVELPLPAGEYRLMVDAASKRGEFSEMPYYFQSAG